MELDGPYYSMLNFFDRRGQAGAHRERQRTAGFKYKESAGAKAKHTYQYAPNESVVATFTATTFFSHDLEPAGAAPGAKPATRGRRGQIGIAMKLTTGILAVGLMTRRSLGTES